jgi:hypothetical protein
MTLDQVHKVGEVVLHAVTVVAIAVAGVWFFLTREAAPHGRTSHEAVSQKISDNHRWVHVDVLIQNVGKRPINIGYCSAKVERVLPLDESQLKSLGNGKLGGKSSEINWPQAAAIQRRDRGHFIEPGEEHRLRFDFVIPANVELVRVYSYFSPDRESGWGWNTTSFHNLKNTELSHESSGL